MSHTPPETKDDAKASSVSSPAMKEEPHEPLETVTNLSTAGASRESIDLEGSTNRSGGIASRCFEGNNESQEATCGGRVRT